MDHVAWLYGRAVAALEKRAAQDSWAMDKAKAYAAGLDSSGFTARRRGARTEDKGSGGVVAAGLGGATTGLALPSAVGAASSAMTAGPGGRLKAAAEGATAPYRLIGDLRRLDRGMAASAKSGKRMDAGARAAMSRLTDRIPVGALRRGGGGGGGGPGALDAARLVLGGKASPKMHEYVRPRLMGGALAVAGGLGASAALGATGSALQYRAGQDEQR